MCLAVAGWWKVHRSLLALRGETVPCLVPRFSECMEMPTHPFQDPGSSERFHWQRRLRPDKHNKRTILVRYKEKDRRSLSGLPHRREASARRRKHSSSRNGAAWATRRATRRRTLLLIIATLTATMCCRSLGGTGVADAAYDYQFEVSATVDTTSPLADNEVTFSQKQTPRTTP